ncbi:cytochrome c oxidase subunit 4 isoform 1, mitochondrial-like isoform X2 [Tubulanus polymorphus]
MASSILRFAGRRVATTSQRALTTSAARHDSHTISVKERAHPRIGDREVVGFGFNGRGNYMDRIEFPCPAIRFKEDTAEIVALKEKEAGDWKNLSVDEKKQLYRSSFCQTYAEMTAPTGDWKSVVAGVLFGFGVAGWFYMWMQQYVYPPKPHTITQEWREANLLRMIQQRQGAVEGVASKWDYEKGDWK